MTVRLLLDEMFAPRIAAALVASGHDCIAVAADSCLRESSDAELLAFASADDRALVTNNVVDFERLRRQCSAAGEPVPTLIYTADSTFPRDRRFIGRLISALEPVCAMDLSNPGGGLWLRPVDR